MAKSRNRAIDAIKGIACIGVVMMHCEFPGIFGGIVQAIFRWAVPFFFAVSGYFCYGESVDRIKKKIVHIAKITLYATLFYILVAWLENHAELAAYAREEFSPINICAFIAANSPVFINGHLWFLFALIYVYITYGLITRYDKVEFSYRFIPVLLVVYYAISYGSKLMGLSIKAGYYRNWLLTGVPFFLMGSWLRKNKSRIHKRFSDEKQVRFLLCVGIASIGTAIIEYLLIGSRSMHVSSTITVFVLFIYSISCDGAKKEGVSLLENIGRNESMMVYILHPAVFKVFDWVFTVFGILDSSIVQWLRPVNTLVWTFALALLWQRISSARHVKAING